MPKETIAFMERVRLPTNPLRMIKSRKRVAKYFSDVTEVTLECGHTKYYKLLKDPDRRARCRQCGLNNL